MKLIESNIKNYEEFKRKFYSDKNIKKDKLIELFEVSLEDVDYYNNHKYLRKLFLEIDLSFYSIDEIKSIRHWLLINRIRIMVNIDLLFFLGLLEKRLDLISAARSTFKKVLEIDNNHIESIRQLAFIYLERNKFDEAIKVFQSIIKIDSEDWASWSDIADILSSQGNNKYALIYMKEALKRNRQDATLISKMAFFELKENNFKKCQSYLNECFLIDIYNPKALYTQALLYKKIGKFNKAYEYNKKVLERNPDYSEARFNLALCALSLGNYEEGFSGFEQRWICNEKSYNIKLPTISRPQWKGEKVYGSSSLAVLKEQGFRNIIQFTRFIPQLLKYFRRIEWVVPESMYELMQENYGCNNIIIHKNIKNIDSRYIDYEIPILSLGLALNLSLENLYAPKVYIKPKEYLLPYFTNKFTNNKNLKIGISWVSKELSLKNEDFSILSKYKNITFVNLQKDYTCEKLPIDDCFNFIEDCNNFNETAALISNLDIIISLDTVIAHLSAAMGKTTYLLNKLSSDWRWIESENTTSWYPTMKIFNQTKLGKWDDIFKNIEDEISKQLK